MILAACCLNYVPTTAGTPKTSSLQKAQSYMTRQSSRFTENKGQIADIEGNKRPDVRFIYAAPGFKAVMKQQGLSYEVISQTVLPKKADKVAGKHTMPDDELSEPNKVSYKIHRVDVSFEGSNPSASLISESAEASYTNYFTHITGEQGATKRRLLRQTDPIKNIYPHIDIVFQAKEEGSLEYDIVVRPGGKLSDVKMKYAGANSLRLASGKLHIATSEGEITEVIPRSFIQENGSEVAVSYTLTENTVSFSAKYDETKTLVVDPSLVWSTYYGGSGDDLGRGIAIDSLGNLLIAGFAASTSGIASSGAYKTSCSGNNDALVLKIKPLWYSSMGYLLWG